MQHSLRWKNALLAGAFLLLALVAVAGWERTAPLAVSAASPVVSAPAAAQPPGGYVGDHQPVRLAAPASDAAGSGGAAPAPNDTALRELSGSEGGFVCDHPAHAR